ncbi:hypothetical protein AB1284_25545 [Bacillus sp. S2(2024)]|uniref:hypothetical protein n=1 Tax=Bacillus sp. S2(2024) TaxID=3162887 RepID=UPI003D1D1975
MKKFIVICLISVFMLTFVGCSSQFDKKTGASTASTTTPTKVVKFENKDITFIELKDAKTNNIKKIDSEATMQTFVDGLQNARKRENVPVDKQARDNMNAIMTIKYRDGDKKEFFVWLEGNNRQVMFIENTNEQYGTAYEVNDTYARNIISLFK